MARRKQKTEQVDESVTEQAAEQVSETKPTGKSYLNRHNGKLQLSDGTVVDAGVSVELSSDQLDLKDVKRLIEDNFLMVQ